MSRRILITLIGFGLLFSLGIFNLHVAVAQEAGEASARQLFYQGNLAYKEGKYDLAIENYEKILDLGLESGNLYYNLGNMYFKKKEFGKALLNYKRALVLIPNDSDLRSNYEYVLSLLRLGAQSFGNLFERLTARLFEGISINFLTILLSALFIIAVVFFVFKVFFAGLKLIGKIIIPVLIILFAISAVALSDKIKYLNNGAVVIVKMAQVKFEPLKSATTYFTLTEGSEVEVIDKTGSWYKVKRPDGKIGWIEKTALGTILGSAGRSPL
jgi:tetratricopeptide (TPR) repeat protein